MTERSDYVGQVLDEKYRLERLLGSGGMGAVYLATHLGTERYVALKLIAPEFMRHEEFVERFKREARAAGRLRHPNVVDVTDFGFAEAGGERVAYLVMEYLDGCTLGDVLEEETRLPLEWVVDILEQVCSAVHEAHQQGIVHRDLKPDNIWLEPNRLGSYRVKVLDFGIAKLAEVNNASEEQSAVDAASGEAASVSAAATAHPRGRATQIASEVTTHIANPHDAATLMPGAAVTQVTNVTDSSGDQNSLEDPTLAYPSGEESSADQSESSEPDIEAAETKLFAWSAATRDADLTLPVPGRPADEDLDRTLRFDHATRPLFSSSRTTRQVVTAEGTELTRIGAIMGTPLYMSPEQCAAKPSDARSDIYSLGVIAYQMLSGQPPFAGSTGSVIREHLEQPPPPLRERSKKVPKRVGDIVMKALAKDPVDRPQTALAFANSLRAQANSIGSLYRRAFALYSEHFPKFLKLSLTAHVPFIVTTISLVVLQLAYAPQPPGWGRTKIALVCAMGIVGLLHVVAQFLAAAVISGMTAIMVTQLSAAPLRPVELRTPLAVLKRRWKPFLKTAIRVTLRILFGYVLLVIPGLIMTVRYALYAPVVLLEGLEKKPALRRARELASRSWRTVIIVSVLQVLIPMVIGAVVGRMSVRVKVEGSSSSSTSEIYQQLTAFINILVVPLISIVPALLYLKMRQLGGESLSALLEQIEEADDRRSQWQERMRTRLSLHTPRSR